MRAHREGDGSFALYGYGQRRIAARATKHLFATADHAHDGVVDQDHPLAFGNSFYNVLFKHPRRKINLLHISTGDVVENDIEVVNYSLNLTQGLNPVGTVRLRIKGTFYQETSVGDGQYNAFMKALWKIYTRLDKEHPTLMDYSVTIPPGGRTDALVETTILWSFQGKQFRTRGLDADQTEAAIKATIKMLNIIEE